MKNSAINFISREHTNNAQLTTLLNAFHATTAFLLQSHAMEQEVAEQSPYDGGARAATEVTVINICQRLDAMMADPERWNMDRQNELETSLTVAYKQTAVTAKAQAEAFRQANLPHRTFEPKFAKIQLTGDWICFFGDLTDLNNAILGMGKTPALALAAFDAMFAGQTPEQLTELLNSYEQKQQVDETASGTTEEASGSGALSQPNCGEDGTQPQSGGTSRGPEQHPGDEEGDSSAPVGA